MRFERDPEPATCAVCDARKPAGSHCRGTWCPREVRKERIRKNEFYRLGGFSNSQLFRLQSRGGAWRYYRRVD